MGYGELINGWIRIVEDSIDHAELGNLLRLAFAASRENVPVPNFRNGPTKELADVLKTVGVKTYTQYTRGTDEIYARQNQTTPGIELMPSRNDGAGFIRLNKQAIRLNPGVSDAELGAAVRETLLKCTTDAAPRVNRD